MTITTTVSNTTFAQLRTKVNQVIGVVNTLGTGNVSNTYLQATFATKAYAASNAAVRLLISDRIQVANVAATYQTKAIERAALANTNAFISTKANWSSLTATNTALRILINDRIQVANVVARYATKAYAASNAYVKLILANTNAYIAAVAASSGGGNGVSLTSLSSSLIPSSNINFDLGSPTKRWRSLYLSNNTIYLGTARITVGTNNNIVFIANNQPAKLEAAQLVVTANTPSSFQNLTITNLVLNNVLGVQYGGTGKTALTQNGVMYASNSTAFAFATGSNGKIMQIGSNGVPKFDDVDGGSFA